MSVLPSQTSISPLDIASGTAISFFLPSGGTPQPPPPSTISSIADILVSSITFGDSTGGFPTSGESMYKGAAATGGGSSSTILLTHSSAPAGVGSLALASLQLLGNPSTVLTSITDAAGTLNFNGSILSADQTGAVTYTASSITVGTVNNAPYVPQPLIRFGQGVLNAGGSTIVTVLGYGTAPYAVSLGGCPSTVVYSRLISSFTAGGPPGSNFSWFTAAATQ